MVVIIIVIVVALIIIGRLADRKEKVFRDEYRKDKKQLRVVLSRQEQLAALSLMYHMANVDGEFENREQHAYARMCAEFMIQPDDAELISYIIMGENFATMTLQKSSARKQDFVLGLILIMMLADNNIEDAELTFAAEYALKIGMSQERFHRISNEIIKLHTNS